MSEADPPAGRVVYADYIAEQIAAQEDRKKSTESRGVTVITTSGTLATLLLGLIALASREPATVEIPEGARDPLSFSLIAFATAAAASMMTNIPLPYRRPNVKGLKAELDQEPPDTLDEALCAVAANRLSILERATVLNQVKGWALVVAMLAEATAIGLLAWAMFEIL